MTLCAPAAAAQEAPVEGRYRLAMSHERAAAIIGEAIEVATEAMGPLRERIAENRLEAKNPVIESVRIQLDDRRARIRYGEHAFDIRRDEFGSLTTPDGESANARARVDGHRLVVDWRLEGARRRDVFTRDGDSLTLSVRISADALPEDVRYRLRFRTAS